MRHPEDHDHLRQCDPAENAVLLFHDCTWWVQLVVEGHTPWRMQSISLWLCNIEMEHGPFIDDVPVETSGIAGFSMAILNRQMVYDMSWH